MAVLALGFIGQAIGTSIGGTILGVTAASIGGFIGSTIGSLLDNMLFGGNKIEGPRLNDLRVMTSTYGKTIPRIYGPDNRLATQVIWKTDLIEKKTTSGGKGGMMGPSVTEYTYSLSAAFLIADGRNKGLIGIRKIYANSKLIYDRDGTGSPPVDKVVFDTLAFYPGDAVQMPDPTIESYLGAGNATAYRHTCYFVLKALQLADFGNRLPNIEVECEADDQITVGEVIADIMTASGADMNALGTSSLKPDLVRGYIIAGQSRAVDAIQPLALVYSFDAAEQGGNMRFIRRGLAPRGFLSYADLGAMEGQPDGEPAEPIRFGLMPGMGLPKEAVVTFNDPARDYQPNAQPSRRQFGDPQSNLSYEVPLVLDADTGRQVADRMLFESEVSRRTAAFEGNERLRRIFPADVWLVESPAGFTRVRITRLLRGANRVYQFESREDDPEIYASKSRGIPAAVPEQRLKPIGDTLVVFIDSPLLRDADDDTGFYYVLAGELSGWRGGDLLRSTDGGASYGHVASIGRSAVLANVPSALGNGPVHVWDRLNTVSVTLDRDDLQLESATELAVLNGANAAWIGDPADPSNGEVIQFATATLTGPRTYTLSDLLRGRMGTEFAVSLHDAAERFVLLDGALQRSDFGPADWNTPRAYKAVSLFQAEADVTATGFTNTGESKRPKSPALVSGSRDGSNNLTVTWTRRTRLRTPGLGNGPVPLGEATEAYEVDVMSGATVLRTLTATSPSVTYSASDQTADGITPGNPVSVRVYQLSDVRGRGHPAAATV